MERVAKVLGPGRVKRGAYIGVWSPGHPLAPKDGYALEHRLVAWDAGLLTDRRHHVHHLNGVKDDNRLENLTVMTAAEHHRHHVAEAGQVTNQHGTFPLQPRACAVDGCPASSSTGGLCSKHYSRLHRYGDVHSVVSRMERALAGVDPNEILRLFDTGAHAEDIARSLGVGPYTVKRVIRESGRTLPVGRPRRR